jgi:formylglycine-generating enzyme required for sulfatase activity
MFAAQWGAFFLTLCFYEPFCLSTFGTTFGKWLFGLEVRLSNGGKCGFGLALKRFLSTYWRGLLPCVLICVPLAIRDVYRTGRTKWDRDYGTDVVAMKLRAPRFIFSLFCVIILQAAQSTIAAKRVQETVRAMNTQFSPISAEAELVRSPDAIPQTRLGVLDQGTVGKVVEVKLPGGDVITFCYCPPGSFTMGSPESEKNRSDNEGPVPVRITKGFWMARTECTQGQWEALMGSNPSQFKGAALPVEQVSWDDVQGFLAKLRQATTLPAGWKYALPSEAQWEYACRAGTSTVFSFGDTLTSGQANFNGKDPYGTAQTGVYLEKTAPAGSYPPNAWGLHDMHGNVWEWCADLYAKQLAGGADPAGAASGIHRVYRGGGWLFNAAYCRAASRSLSVPSYRGLSLGFRPALVRSTISER